MTHILRASRRRVLGFLLSTVLSLRVPRALAGPGEDRGIGGTGAVPTGDEADRGIGGTGVIGTIRKFGSIIVNDLRIAYANDADVRIDGRPASVADLRIGQVVRVAALGDHGAFSTRAIDVQSEVVGPITTIAPGRMVVLGQTVATGSVRTKGLKRGDTVAISGLRRNDGTIVASLAERRDGASYRLVGPIDVARDGALTIGRQKLASVNPDLVGRRAVLDGTLDGRTFVVAHGTSETTLLPRGIRALSVETYVERRGGGLASGSGFALDGETGFAVPAGQSVRAVLTTSVGTDGRLTLDSLRAGGKTYDTTGSQGGSLGGSRGPGTGAEGPPGRPDANGRTPMNFGSPSGGGAGAPGSPGAPPGGGGMGGPAFGGGRGPGPAMGPAPGPGGGMGGGPGGRR